MLFPSPSIRSPTFDKTLPVNISANLNIEQLSKTAKQGHAKARERPSAVIDPV